MEVWKYYKVTNILILTFHLYDTVKNVGGAVSALKEDGDVPGDAGGDEGLVAGGDEEGGGDWLGLGHHSPDASLVDAGQERCEAVVGDLSQAQPGLESLADQGELAELVGSGQSDWSDLLGPQLTGLQLLGQLVHQLLQELVLCPQLLAVRGLDPGWGGAQPGSEVPTERSPQVLGTKSCSVKDRGPPVSRVPVSESLHIVRS